MPLREPSPSAAGATARRLPIHVLIPALVVVALAAAGAGIYWYYSAPKVFRVGVAQANDPGTRVIAAFARALEEEAVRSKGRVATSLSAARRIFGDEPSDTRLEIVPFAKVREAGEALQQGKVDLALVRPDIFLPSTGMTIAVLREEAVIVVAPSADVADLGDKRIGVVATREADLTVIRTVLGFHEILSPAAAIERIEPDDMAAALSQGRIDAVATIAPVGQAASDLVTAVRRAARGEMAVVSLTGSSSLAAETPAFVEMKIPAGSLGGRPRLPAEDLATIGVTYRLMAHAELDRDAVADLTEDLFQMRTRVAKTEPITNLMKAPDDDSATSAALPNHPGAIDYLTREQQTFMDRYGDWLWFGLFFAGSASSAAAWAAQFVARRRRERVDEVLDRILAIAFEARAAEDVAALDGFAGEIDELVVAAVRETHSRASSTRAMTALMLAIDTARAAIQDRRQAVGEATRMAGPGLRAVEAARR